MKYKYHKDGELPKNKEMFVFGSNLSGIHGAGAARVAYKEYNAQWGIGFGPMGINYNKSKQNNCSFAIPTKNWKIETMPLNDIKTFVDQFSLYTHLSNLNFFLTRIGCGLAGYKDEDIAPMFISCNTNCNFPENWKEYLE